MTKNFKSMLCGTAMAVAVVGTAGKAHALSVTFGGTVAGDGSGLTTSVAGATVTTFNTGVAPGNYSGAGSVVSIPNVPSGYAAPLGDATFYLAVAYPNQVGSETIALGSVEDYFGLYWGSMDAYNSLDFYLGATLLGHYTGSDVSVLANGDQSSVNTNKYVNFFFDASGFDKIVLNTTNFAFESDNHALARLNNPVPEPATLTLIGTGVAGLIAARRRKRNLAK